MTDMLSHINGIESAVSVSDVDVFCVASATLTKGQLVCIPASNVLSGAVATVTTPTTTQRQTGMIGVCLQDAASGDRIRVRVQGRCSALTKGDGAATVAVGDQLFVGTGGALSGAATQMEADEAISQMLLEKGITKTSLKYKAEYDRIWEENKISDLPLK